MRNPHSCGMPTPRSSSSMAPFVKLDKIRGGSRVDAACGVDVDPLFPHAAESSSTLRDPSAACHNDVFCMIDTLGSSRYAFVAACGMKSSDVLGSLHRFLLEHVQLVGEMVGMTLGVTPSGTGLSMTSACPIIGQRRGKHLIGGHRLRGRFVEAAKHA